MSISSFAETFSVLDLQEKLATQSLFRGQYIQTKQMKMFKKPLLSKGNFVLQQKEGLLWLQEKPFLISLVLTQNKLSQQFADQPAQVIEATDNPMVFYFSHLFLSLFKGDVEALTNQFELQLEGDSEQWTLLLIPKEAPLNKVFKTINITGSEFINELQLVELNKDSSTIQFINQNNNPAYLTDDEQHYFQL